MLSGDEFYDDDVTSGILDESPEPEEPEAWHRYDLATEADGTISGTTETNDNNDDGYPDGDVERWNVHYRDRAHMLKELCGGSHYGISGVHVLVFLDGEEVKR